MDSKKSNLYSNCVEFDELLRVKDSSTDTLESLGPFKYISNLPGKDIRGKLIECFNSFLSIPQERVEDIKSIVGALHNSSLLIDDIEDSSKLRRGVPVAHSIFGIPLTINCANYALAKLQELQSSRAMEVFVIEMLSLHQGQGLDILWRDKCVCPSEEDYKKMVIGKTGGLFRLAIGLMQSFSESDNKYSVKNFNPLLNLLGLYFQIRDDLLNISDFNYMENKAFCEDLTEGKFSFPIIHAINLYPSDNRVLNILRQRTTDIDIKKYAVRLLKEFGSLSYTKDVLNSLFLEIIELVENNFDGQENLIQLLYYLNKDVENIKVDDIITYVSR